MNQVIKQCVKRLTDGSDHKVIKEVLLRIDDDGDVVVDDSGRGAVGREKGERVRIVEKVQDLSRAPG